MQLFVKLRSCKVNAVVRLKFQNQPNDSFINGEVINTEGKKNRDDKLMEINCVTKNQLYNIHEQIRFFRHVVKFNILVTIYLDP